MNSIICIASIALLLFVYSSQCTSISKCCCNPKTNEYKLVPLYELYQPKTDTYFYTISRREMTGFIEKKGYIKKGVIGLVAASKTDCKGGQSLNPIYRWCNEATSDYIYDTKPDKKSLPGYKLQGIAFYGAPISNKCGATWTWYRYLKGKRHVYTTNPADITTGKQVVVCGIWPTSPTPPPTPTPTPPPTPTPTPTPPPTPPPTLPPKPPVNGTECTMRIGTLYRLNRPSTSSHLYTTSYAEASEAVKNLQYLAENSPGLVAYTSDDCSCGNTLKPVYRVYKLAPKEDHFYTMDNQEAINAVSKLGYKNEGIAFYCTSTLGKCGASLALNRYLTGHSHFYTTDSAEGKKTVAAGGVSEGVLCYIFEP